MKNLLFILLIFPFFLACSSSEDTNEDSNIVYPKTDSIFGYRIGSTIEEVKPDIIRSLELAFSYSVESGKPGTVFYFKNGYLTTICKYYPSLMDWFNGYNFINDVKSLNPPTQITISNPISNPNYYTSEKNRNNLYIIEDSTKWTAGHFNIMVRNDYFSFDSKNIDRKDFYHVIEYTLNN